jgi:internalin A
VYGKFDPKEEPTDGIWISEWKLTLRGEEVRLHVWDFGGQEILHATHQFFLTPRSLYLLVLEGRRGTADADAEYWLRLIESFATEDSGEVSPVLVVLNKIKVQPFDLSLPNLQRRYPFIRGLVKTDCQDGTGIGELRGAVERETDHLAHLRDPFPAKWFAIKDTLASMKATLNKNYISFDQYRQVCVAQHERDPLEQDKLAFYLHSLGVALNYKDDPRLCDMNVLNPQWVTNGIYKILKWPRLEKQKGEIHLADAAGILDPAEYPLPLHRFLFDLMQKFELCFTFPDNDAHYLIPELLGKEEPPEAAQFETADCLNFEYLYPILPEGLLPRFIVRTHALRCDKLCWHTGVILTFEDNRALVKADVADVAYKQGRRCVSIAVTGPGAGRRQLLAVIRSDFERIHADISKLRPEAQVPVPEYPGLSIAYENLLIREREDEEDFTEPFQGHLVRLNVQELLNGVDIEGARERVKGPEEPPIRLFISYSRKDETPCNQLETQLKLLQRRGLISIWHDRKIEAGDDWRERIDENLERADIILFLVSADFIASDYCYDKEMRRALKRGEAGETQVIPVIVRDVSWSLAPFGMLAALPTGGKAVMSWSNKDAAWRNVSEGIAQAVEHIRAKRRKAEISLVGTHSAG